VGKSWPGRDLLFVIGYLPFVFRGGETSHAREQKFIRPHQRKARSLSVPPIANNKWKAINKKFFRCDGPEPVISNPRRFRPYARIPSCGSTV
jgi:hypothetical protein